MAFLPYLSMAALAVGGLLLVAARFHKQTFRPMVEGDPRKERLLYWSSSLIGGALCAVSVIQYGWKPVVAVTIAFLVLTVIQGPHPLNRRRWDL